MTDDRDIIINQGRGRGGRVFSRALIPLFYLVALLLVILAVKGLIVQLDPSTRALAEAEAYRRAAMDASLQPVDLFVSALWRLIPPVLLAGAAITGLLIAWRRWGWRESIGAHYLAEVTRADRQHLPAGLHSLNYNHAPRLDYKPFATPPALIDAPDVEEEGETPSMAELLARGRVGRGNPLILGYEHGKELSGTWLDLYATINAGLPGSGKTTTQRFFAVQTALHGAKFAIGDPHAGAADDSLAATLDPLRDIFLCEPASEPRAVLDLVRYVADIGEKRIKGQDASRTPIILWLDELTGLLGRSDVGDQLAELLEKIAQEYRKRFIYLSASGQIWTAARATSELRDSFASIICHRMKRSQARLLLPTEEAAQVERLPTGQAVLWRTNGATSIITIPNTTAADVRSAAKLLTDSAPVMPRLISQDAATIQPGNSEVSTSDYSAPQRPETLTPEAARIVALFLDGKDAGAIVTELTGMNSKRGTPYLHKLAEVQGVIRQALRGYRAAA